VLSGNAYTLSPGPPRPTEPLKEGEILDGINWDEYLSIDLIRQHTKTADVPGITDEQLRLYRGAAVEAAEFYTGLTLRKQKVFTEILPVKKPKLGHDYVIVRLQFPSSDGIIYIYGNNQHPDAVHVPPSTRKVRLPNRFFYSPDLSNCCNPCSVATNGLRIMYRAGFSSANQVPAGVLLGILQFIAWVVEHPGDEVLAMRNTLSARGGALIGTNNIALISGALESWRQFDPEAA
jgi:hypothetical protein